MTAKKLAIGGVIALGALVCLGSDAQAQYRRYHGGPTIVVRPAPVVVVNPYSRGGYGQSYYGGGYYGGANIVRPGYPYGYGPSIGYGYAPITGFGYPGFYPSNYGYGRGGVGFSLFIR